MRNLTCLWRERCVWIRWIRLQFYGPLIGRDIVLFSKETYVRLLYHMYSSVLTFFLLTNGSSNKSILCTPHYKWICAFLIRWIYIFNKNLTGWEWLLLFLTVKIIITIFFCANKSHHFDLFHWYILIVSKGSNIKIYLFQCQTIVFILISNI